MDKASLLEKLKTQKKQLQLHLNNEGSLDPENDDENKENSPDTLAQKEISVSSSMFLDRIPPNILAQALRQVNLNCSEKPGNISESEIHSGVLAEHGYPGSFQPKTTGNLEYEHIHGLQIDAIQNNKYGWTFDEEITPIKVHREVVLSDAHYEYSESEDGFSEVGDVDYMDVNGCRPLSETSDDDSNDLHDLQDTITNNSRNENLSEKKSCTAVVADMFSDHIENTVIELNDSKTTLLEKPITPGISRNRSFHELIEDKLQEENKFSVNAQKSVVVSSTPVKKQPRKFLKRGEGLKRFQLGEYSKCRKGSKSMEDKTKSGGKGQKEDKVVIKGVLDAGVSLKTCPESALAKCDPPSSSTKNSMVINMRGILKKNKDSASSLNNRYTQRNHNLACQDSDLLVGGRKKEYPKAEVAIAEEPRKVTFGDQKDLMRGISVSESADIDFQKMLCDRLKNQEREAEELDVFEELEEAAENMSLSSNCSLVIKHFGQRPNSSPVIENKELENTMVELENKKQVETDSALCVGSYHFDDKASWSDDSNVSEKDDTMTRDESSREPSPEPIACPPKRIVCKKKADVLGVTPNAEAVVLDKTALDRSTEESISRSTGNVSDIVKKKLAELEKEITKYRTENNKLLELRCERENGLKQLRKEIETFQKEKTVELERIKEYRNEELKKIKNERKLFDKYQKEIKATPSKEEREEIRELKLEVSKLKDESKNKESKWNAASHRFRTRAAELEEENSELREEIKLLEKQRLERWKSTETDQVDQLTSSPLSVNSDPPSTAHSLISTTIPPMSLDEQYGLGINKAFIQESTTSVDNAYHLPKHIGIANNLSTQKEIKHADGKVEVILPDQSRIISFPNGTQKTISKDEKTVTVSFFNGDIKKTINDKLVYYYAESETTHTTYPDGLEMLEFPNGQVEKRYSNGKTEVIFPDKTVKVIHSDGTEETTFTDGTVQKIDISGVRMISFANGQKEIHTKEYKRREYPNGTVKTVYGDGKQETRYSNGRIRMKDSDGNLILDTGGSD